MLFNAARLNPEYRIRMYHVNALDEKMISRINVIWNELLKHEITLAGQDRTLSKIIRDNLPTNSTCDVYSDKFIAYMADVEWVYLIERGNTQDITAFMAVSKDRQILSLFTRSYYRKYGFGTYLINNHMEIFGGSVSLQCFRLNEDALRFYKRHGFKISHEAKEGSGDTYHTLVLTV